MIRLTRVGASDVEDKNLRTSVAITSMFALAIVAGTIIILAKKLT